MALTPQRWIVAVVLGCAAIAVAYWPEPRDSEYAGRQAKAPMLVTLGDAFQTAGQLAVLERRDALLASLHAREPRAGGPPVLRIDVQLPLPDRDILTRVFASLVETWGPFAPDIASALIITTDSARAGEEERVRYFVNGFWHFHPEGKENLCLSVAFISPRDLPWMAHTRPADEVRDWLSKAMGACAFYTAFGKPGPAVEDWLRWHNDAFARSPDWHAARPPIDAPPAWSELSEATTMGILLDLLMGGYMAGRNELKGYALRGCAAGRPDLCAFILDSTQLGYAPMFGARYGVSQTRSWVWNPTESSGFLADLVHGVGRDRFVAFWRADAPRDEAFQKAVGQDLLTYTRTWAKSRFERLRVGPGLPLQVPLLALVLTMALASATAAFARRRQVR